MLRNLSLRFKRVQQQRSTLTLSPVTLPEILVIIFSYLSDDTLRQSVAPVCRLWLQTVQDVIVREVVCPLQQLELFITKFAFAPLDKFPYPTSLTSLKLTLHRGYVSDFSLTKILTLCPVLETFNASIYSTSIITVQLEPFEQQEEQKALSLRSLVLQGFHLDMSRIKNLLTMTPRLRELKLIDMAMGWPYVWSPLLTYIQTLPLKLESTHFSYNNRATHSTEADTIMSLIPQTSEWSLWGLDVKPSLLQSLDTTPNVVTTLDLYWSKRPQSYHSPCHGPDLSFSTNAIHQFLCDSPNLLHLRVVRTVFTLWNMDLFGRRTFGDLEAPTRGCTSNYVNPDTAMARPSTGRPGIWKCRNLRTLQFEINAHRDCFAMNSPVHSRILFGYLSRVCPNLEDLHITWPSLCEYGRNQNSYTPRLSLQLEGGICLLARLRSLRRLKIEEYYLCQGPDCQVYEMNWMSPSGRDTWSRRKRQEVMAQWRHKEAEENRLEGARRKFGGVRRAEPASNSTEDLAIAKELKNLGLLEDVRNMVKEMDSSSFVCLPDLQRISFEYPFDNLPRNELYRLFPKTSYLSDTSLKWSVS
ncbi:hypothetical protein BGX23_008585 [Mortierella sp. AD031]|nr:hypothetical protein BGX23_008585 [Mortierella sp. AD031]